MISKTNSLMLATHNHSSIVKAWDLLRGNEVKTTARRRHIVFAQLYGIGDDITYGLIHNLRSLPHHPKVTVSVVKYIPYGPVDEVLPYLVRRAEENRGMFSCSMLEREALYKELKRRIRALITF